MFLFWKYFANTQRYLYVPILVYIYSSVVKREHNITALHCGYNMAALIRWKVTPIRNSNADVTSLIYRTLL